MELKLVDENNKILSGITREWDFDHPETHLGDLIENMFETMRSQRGLGLAAPQIGLPYRVFVIEINGIREEYVNPEIVRKSEDTDKHEEGCLSFGDLRLPVERSMTVTIRFQNRLGTIIEQDYSGLWAIAVQHENDHMSGVCIVNKVSRLVLNMARKKLKKRTR